MVVIGRTNELKVATDLTTANDLLNKGWSLVDAKVESKDEFVFLLAWFGQPRQQIFSMMRDSAKTQPA